MRAICMLFAGLFLVACSKEPGEGGGASIKGRVFKEVRVVPANPGSAVATYPAADEDVFIIYGDNLSPDDRIRTNYDGEFEFQFLRRGSYQVYLLSADTSSDASIDPSSMPVIREIEVNDRREEIDLGDITIYEEF